MLHDIDMASAGCDTIVVMKDGRNHDLHAPQPVYETEVTVQDFSGRPVAIYQTWRH